MSLTETCLQALLLPRPVKFFSRVGSTQNIAQTWLEKGATSGSVVICDEQLAGRGRQGRVWYTPPGVAIALSVILHPPIESLSQVTMLGALAIAELLENQGAPCVTIKWPNDVRLKGKKISGVLPEAIWEGNVLKGVVLGLGINVRNNFADTDLETSAFAMSHWTE